MTKLVDKINQLSVDELSVDEKLVDERLVDELSSHPNFIVKIGTSTKIFLVEVNYVMVF
jgi:hypothetical protein